ncbi:MAG: sulfatase [Planctomycetes bacterium]|nr:sulfatase [Planctomycetota bacterium]
MRAALLVSLLLMGCGGSPPAPAARLRLWTRAAELEAAPAPSATRPVFAASFEPELEGWNTVAYPTRGPAELEARVEHEQDRAFLRLTGVHGGLQRVLQVEPGTCYVFTGMLRASGLEFAGGEQGFRGASVWLGEASAEAELDQLMGPRADLLVSSWSGPSAFGQVGWQTQRHLFVTTPHTRFLHLVCSLAVAESVRAGKADFADLRLEVGTLALAWREALTAETALRADVDPPKFPWQSVRRVSAQLGGEHRPSIVLLPGERLRFALPELAAGARLVAGAGAWRPEAMAGFEGSATLRVRGVGRELTARTFASSGNAAQGRWQEFELELDGSALEFEASGDAPLLVGAPLVRTDAPRSSGANVLLISIDTLRADHVGAYGYTRATTPELDALARRGLLCRDASTQAPYTLPAHATLLSGQFPSVHGVVTRGRTLAAARSTSLAETLGQAGFATRAFTAGGFVNPVFGLDYGFEGFAQIDPIREEGSHYLRSLARRHGPELAARLVEEHGFAGLERWLGAHRDERFFLFLHTYTVHDYDAPERFLACGELACPRPPVPLRTRTAAEAAAFTPEMRAHVVHLYDAALRYTDARLGRLFAHMQELGVLDDTLIVVTSDHGEEFFEHGALQHGRTLYQELLGIPLILAGPGIEPRVLTRAAMLADVAPTLLARLGFARDDHMQGVDLLGPDWPARALWSEVDDPFAHKYALREEHGPKTIYGPETPALLFPNARAWEHYDLAADPGEERARLDGADIEAARARLLRQKQALEELGQSLGKTGLGGVDAGTMEELRELGY